MQRFTDLHIVVTGATGELGSTLVQALLAEGAHCHLPCRSAAKLSTLLRESPQQLTVVEGIDPTREDQVQSFYSDLPDLWASIHCVGTFRAGALAQAKLEDLEELMSTNAVSAFLCSRAALARMRKPRGGRIVNIAARSALEPRTAAGAVAYAMSKAAVSALTLALAEEAAPSGILVNAIAPGTLDTPANRKAMPSADPSRWVQLDEVAAAILQLASPENRSMHGAILPMFGNA